MDEIRPASRHITDSHLPFCVTLVRHGKSVINAMIEASRRDDHSAFTPEMVSYDASLWELHPEGRVQAVKAGEYLRRHTPDFQGHYHSPYIRAQQTAALLNLSDSWEEAVHFRERHMGAMSSAICLPEWLKKFEQELQERDRIPAEWVPPGEHAESLLMTKDRAELGYSRIFRKHACQNIVVVSHHDSILAQRAVLERLEGEAFSDILRKGRGRHKRIGNGYVLEYTRIDPYTGTVHPWFAWMRVTDPVASMKPGPWERIT
jgi:broad specificity phosphatase PhoE